MKLRLLEISLFAVASTGLSYYVGGIGLSVIFLSAFFLWAAFSAYDFFPTYSRYLASLVISTVIPVLTVVVVVPQLARNSWLRSMIFTPPSSTPTDYIAIDSNTLGTTNQWVLLTIFGLFLLAILVSLALRNHSWKSPENHKSAASSTKTITSQLLQNTYPAISRYVVLTPLIALSYLQQLGHTKSLAFMMSGDSRNIFRTVMRTRVTSSYPSLRGLFQNGRFGETLASSISALNGTSGFPRVADLIAMRSTYVIVFSLIVASISVLLTANSEKWTPYVTPVRDATIFALSVLILSSPYPFAEILRSGFFSFFVGLGFLTATVALIVPSRIDHSEVVLLASFAAITTYLSYQPAALLVVLPLCGLATQFLWRRYQSEVGHKLISLSIIAFALVGYFAYRPLYERLVVRVGASGEIWPTDTRFTLLVLLISCVLIPFSKGNLRRTVLTTAATGISSILSLRLLDIARGMDPDIYYLMKFRYATNFISGILCIAIIAAVFNEPKIWNRAFGAKTFLNKNILMIRTAILIGLIGALSILIPTRTQAPSPLALMKNGWDAPSEIVTEKTFALWKENSPYIFAGYFDERNERIANFWSPYFWEVNRWEWTYNNYSVSAEGLCGIIGSQDVLVYTRISELKKQLYIKCSATSGHIKLRSTEQNLFLFETD